MTTTTRAVAPTREGGRRTPADRRRPRLVADTTGVRIKEHAARDRELLDLLDRLSA